MPANGSLLGSADGLRRVSGATASLMRSLAFVDRGQ